MSNVGRQFPSEITTFVDEKSGRKIKQLTKTGTNVHFYFTENYEIVVSAEETKRRRESAEILRKRLLLRKLNIF